MFEWICLATCCCTGSSRNPAGLLTKTRFLPQDDSASMPEEHRGIVNVDGERPLVVVRASGAHSDISFGKDHLGIGVAIGASLNAHALRMLMLSDSN